MITWLRAGRRALPPLALLTMPIPAFAHTGRAPAPHDLWHSWSAPPVVIAGVVLGSWLYLRGIRRLWARAGLGAGVPRWRVWCWLGGMTAVLIALCSPVDAVAEALFAVHMVQHLLLMFVAAPLIALSEPLLPTLFALSPAARRGVGGWWRRAVVLRSTWRTISRPTVAWVLHVSAMLAWHLPRLYDAAARSPAIHVLEHLSFVATALVFWWVIADRRSRRRLGTGASVLYLFGAALVSTLLGAALTLAPHPWYTAHWTTTAAWGLNPLEDQQIAGLIMWVPGGLVYLAALAPILVRVLQRDRAPSRRS